MKAAAPSAAAGSAAQELREMGLVDGGWGKSFAFAGTVVIIGFLLVFLRPILVPFVLAIFLAYLVRPIVESVSRCRCWCFRKRYRSEGDATPEEQQSLLDEDADAELSMPPTSARELRAAADPTRVMKQMQTVLPRWVGVVLAMLIAIGVIAGVLLAFVAAASYFEALVPVYRERAQEVWQRLIKAVRDAFEVDLGELRSLPSRFFSSFAGTFISSSFSIITDVFLIIVFLGFLLAQPPAPQSSLRKKIDDSVSRYLILKSAISFSVACAVYLLMLSVSFPLALFIALSTCAPTSPHTPRAAAATFGTPRDLASAPAGSC